MITHGTDDTPVGLNNFFFTLQGFQKEFAMTVFHGNDVTLTMEFFHLPHRNEVGKRRVERTNYD